MKIGLPVKVICAFALTAGILSAGKIQAQEIPAQPAIPAQPDKPAAASAPNGTISLDVTEAHLEDVLKLLSKQSGINFVASEEARSKKITTYLDGVPAHAALISILEANRLTLRSVEGQNLYIVTDAGSKRVATVTKVFQLKYARVTPTAGDTAASFGTGGSLVSTVLSGSSGGGAAAGSGGGAAGATTGGIVEIVRSLLSANGSVITDPRTNSLIATDIPAHIRNIEETIAKLDVKQKQLFIEAEILEVTLETLRRIGVEYGGTDGSLATLTAPIQNTYFPFKDRALLTVEGDLPAQAEDPPTLGSIIGPSAIFKLIASDSDTKFLARPRLLTLSNEVAEIRIIAEAVTSVVNVTVVGGTGGAVNSSTVERRTVGTILRVTPMVNDDKYVTMVIEPEVSRAIASGSFPSLLDPNRRVARTTVMVEDGETTMIAGLISDENTKTGRKIPVLGDIPILGVPFRRTDTDRSNSEIIVFITPHIVQENPSILVAQEREQTPISSKEQRLLEGHHRRILRERAIAETIENITR